MMPSRNSSGDRVSLKSILRFPVFIQEVELYESAAEYPQQPLEEESGDSAHRQPPQCAYWRDCNVSCPIKDG